MPNVRSDVPVRRIKNSLENKKETKKPKREVPFNYLRHRGYISHVRINDKDEIFYTCKKCGKGIRKTYLIQHYKKKHAEVYLRVCKLMEEGRL